MLSTLLLLKTTEGHGFLSNPVARNLRGSGHPVTTDCPMCLGHNNADANNIHGICGDGPSGPQQWAQPGPITSTYVEGSNVNFEMRITANHLGWIEMDLCDSPDITEECFARHRLERVGCMGSAEECRATWVPAASVNVAGYTTGNGAAYPTGAPYFVYDGGNTFGANLRMQYKLPVGVTCTHCVVRWHYHSTNSCVNPNSGSEEFWNCADIAITASSGEGTKDTTLSGAELEALSATLVSRAPTGKVAGAMGCATFGRPFGNGGFASVAPEGKNGYADAYGIELAEPGFTFGCTNQPATGVQGCIHQRTGVSVALWGSGITAPTTTVDPTTQASSSSSSTTSSDDAFTTASDDKCAAVWGKCGGQGWDGPECCTAGRRARSSFSRAEARFSALAAW